MVGDSVAMRRVFAVLERASSSSAPVLLLGESGTGKELAARAVHERSPRKNGPFVVFDCGAASETLIESELFGHKRGAFTGADADRPGAFARAHGGTLFLDEIGDLPIALQPKLLRLAEQGEVTPLGARASERYDVRLVAATHRDLWAEVARGAFRGDLYYRLAVVEVRLPPLRERAEDVPALARTFLESHGVRVESPNLPAFHRLAAYGWPGNVRELRNVLMRAVALAPANPRFEDLPILLRPDSAGGGDPPLARADLAYHEKKAAILARFDRDYLSDLMRREGTNLAQAARVAGLERKYLYKLLARAGLLPDRSKPETQ
jgi:DNA-binding NtrC family response regulator